MDFIVYQSLGSPQQLASIEALDSGSYRLTQVRVAKHIFWYNYEVSCSYH